MLAAGAGAFATAGLEGIGGTAELGAGKADTTFGDADACPGSAGKGGRPSEASEGSGGSPDEAAAEISGKGGSPAAGDKTGDGATAVLAGA